MKNCRECFKEIQDHLNYCNRKCYLEWYSKDCKLKGRCRKCNNPALPGIVYCKDCSKKNIFRSKVWRENKYNNGFCRFCKLPRLPNRKTCKACSERKAKDCAEKRLSRINQGLCENCGIILDGKSKSLCLKCLEIANTHNRNRRKYNRENGICEICNAPAIRNKIRKCSWCKICYLKQTSKRHFGTNNRWQELEDLFKKQNICPYSGRKLILGVNASLDHIDPKSRGGDPNNINNLQWVFYEDSIDINRMKDTMNDFEFKNLMTTMRKNIKNSSEIDLSSEVDLTSLTSYLQSV